MRPRPQTKFEGVKLSRWPASSYSARPASAPVSWKEPASSRRSMRSRTGSRPASRCRATRSSPPICFASSVRRAISSSSGFQVIAARIAFDPARRSREGARARLRRGDLRQRARGVPVTAETFASVFRRRGLAARRRRRAHALYAQFLEAMPLGNRAEDYAVLLAAIVRDAKLPDQAAYDAFRASLAPERLRAFHKQLLPRARRLGRARSARLAGADAALPRPLRRAPPPRRRRAPRDRDGEGSRLRAEAARRLRRRRAVRGRLRARQGGRREEARARDEAGRTGRLRAPRGHLRGRQGEPPRRRGRARRTLRARRPGATTVRASGASREAHGFLVCGLDDFERQLFAQPAGGGAPERSAGPR